MPKIVFMPEHVEISVQPGVLLSAAAQQAGVRVSLPCGGKGMCGKCLMRVYDGHVRFENNGKLAPELIKQGYVLACRSTIENEDVTVETVSRLNEEKGSFSDAMSHLGIDETLFPKAEEIDPICQWRMLLVHPPEMLDGLGDYDRFCNAVQEQFPQHRVVLPLALLRVLPQLLREQEGNLAVCAYLTGDCVKITDIRMQIPENDYGVCIDIGTTTVAVQLAEMTTGRIIAAKTSYNAQIERGLDVISRISYAKNQERIAEMRELVLSTINQMLRELAAEMGIAVQDIHNVSVAANTTMTQMLLGIIPEYIRLEPYTPAVFAVPLYDARTVGLEICPETPVYFAPNVGSYVGGDITSGLLCTEFAQDAEDIDLFIDIGTNGEIVLGNCDFLLGCACSAGPAFEGGGIEFGMRASQGAIETVEVDRETGVAQYSTIGDVQAKGICGSGLISLVAQLYSCGVIDQRGKFDRSGKYSSVQLDGKRAVYVLVPPEGDYRGVYITEMDIDNLIRAKAAIFSACRTLLKSVELDFDCLSHIYIAGGFGRYIDIEKAQMIGLLPKIDAERFQFIGNSSLAGAHMTLLSSRHLQKETELAGKITYLDLSTEPGYMDEYISAMFIPHTDTALFAD